MKKPYVVDVTEILHREVIVWAEDSHEAYGVTGELCNVGEIYLGDSDFIGREIYVDGLANEFDGLDQYNQ